MTSNTPITSSVLLPRGSVRCDVFAIAARRAAHRYRATGCSGPSPVSTGLRGRLSFRLAGLGLIGRSLRPASLRPAVGDRRQLQAASERLPRRADRARPAGVSGRRLSSWGESEHDMEVVGRPNDEGKKIAGSWTSEGLRAPRAN
jgi:hypothetical protein